MKILIVAQNLFIARILTSLADSHQYIESYDVIVFSLAEKIILERIHGLPADRIIYSTHARGQQTSKIYAECIEEKRGTIPKHLISSLQSNLMTTLHLQDDVTYDHIWIFNKHTFIGAALKDHSKYSEKCIVFENSNKRGGVTILGDMNLAHGEALRDQFLDSYKFRKAIPKLRFPKVYRLITLIFHIRSVQGVRYFITRLLTRLINVVIFSVFRVIQTFMLKNSRSKLGALFALQIKHDSAIAMHIDFDTYCDQLIKKALEIRAENPDIDIILRPHPQDYTFGWLSVVARFRSCIKRVTLDFSNLDHYSKFHFKYLVSFNSNISRLTHFQNGRTKIVILQSENSTLPSHDSKLLQFYEEIF